MLFYIDMYSLEYSGMLYVFILSSSVWLSLLASCKYSKLCKTLPLMGLGGDQLLTPSFQFFFLLKQYIYTYLSALYGMRICYVL